MISGDLLHRETHFRGYPFFSDPKFALWECFRAIFSHFTFLQFYSKIALWEVLFSDISASIWSAFPMYIFAPSGLRWIFLSMTAEPPLHCRRQSATAEARAARDFAPRRANRGAFPVRTDTGDSAPEPRHSMSQHFKFFSKTFFKHFYLAELPNKGPKQSLMNRTSRKSLTNSLQIPTASIKSRSQFCQ
jgi:hypothetical protein